MIIFTTRFCLLLLLATLIACSGWHLRGSNPQINTANLNNAVFLSGNNSATYNATLRLLKSQGLLSTANNNIQLELGAESWQSRTASLNADGLAAETELTLIIPYRILQKQVNNETTTLANTRAQLSRSYIADTNDIGAKEKEERELRNDMSNAAARAIIRRLSLLTAQ